MSEICHAPPTGHMLESLANASLGWRRALGEWIDNALDAGARRITFDFSVTNELMITDDGNGCKNLQAMIQLGNTQASHTTKLGRFGIGGKEAAIWVGGSNSVLNISSVHDLVERNLKLNWRDFAKSNWEYSREPSIDVGADKRGTKILICSHKQRRSLPTGEAFLKLVEDLGYLFAPAIKEGCSITLITTKSQSRRTLSGWKRPDLEPNIVDQRIEVDGKGARVICGIVSGNQPNPRAGFTYWHGWRVIEAASPNGCGRYSARQICGIVQLDKQWRLTKHKDGISSGAEALYAEVERVCKHLLERGQAIGSSLESEQFRTQLGVELNNILSGAIDAKAKRKGKKPGEPKAGVETSGSGGKHRKAALEQPGSQFRGRHGRRFEFDWWNWGEATPIAAIKENRIILNLDNPFIAKAKASGSNRELVVLAICMISNEHCVAPGGQFTLPALGHSNDFAKVVGGLLAAPDLTLDSGPALEIVR